jgi:hypothetical protein
MNLKWNRVADVMPRSKTRVLVFDKYKEYSVAWYDKKVNSWYTDSSGDVKLLGDNGRPSYVTHWMRLKDLSPYQKVPLIKRERPWRTPPHTPSN